MTDPIADMLTRIRNALAVRKPIVRIPYSNLKYAIALSLERGGYITKAERRGRRERRSLELHLKYLAHGRAAISGLERISRPGRRVYQKVGALRPFRQGAGFIVLSTPQGILDSRQARKRNVGGEVLLAVW